MSTDQLLAAALLARLATITQANGYSSNAGLHVFDGATGVPDNIGAFLVLAESEEGVASQKGQGGKPDDVKVSLPFTVEGRAVWEGKRYWKLASDRRRPAHG